MNDGLSVSSTSQSWGSVCAVSLQSGRLVRIQVTSRNLVLLPWVQHLSIHTYSNDPKPFASVRISNRDSRLALRHHHLYRVGCLVPAAGLTMQGCLGEYVARWTLVCSFVLVCP